MEAIIKEVRLAIRRLLHAKMVTLLALATLALGIGANSAIFTVVNAVLIRPLPFTDAERIVRVYRMRGEEEDVLSGPAFLGLHERVRSLDIAVFSNGDPTLTGAGDPARLPATWVSRGYFDIMGVKPLEGRVFAPEENESGRDGVVVLGEGLWRTRFGGDSRIIGREVMVNSRPRVVVGILPESFARATGRAFWLPLEYDEDLRDPSNFYSHWLEGVGRLKPGVSVEQARGDLAREYLNLQKSLNQENPRSGAGAEPLRDSLVGDVRTPLLILLGAVGLVLLIACANLANLLLAQAAGRQTEFAVRRALGASPSRLVGQLFIESVVLAAAGGALGLLAGSWGAVLLAHLQAQQRAGAVDFSVDWRVIGFTAAISLLAAIAFGVLPALQVARFTPAPLLREGGRGGTGSRRSNRLRGLLVVAETALAIMLLIGAGLLLRSFARLNQVDPGFTPEQTLSFELQLPSATYESDASQIDFYNQLLQRLRALPGVRSVGATNIIPLNNVNMAIVFRVDGRPEPTRENAVGIDIRMVTPGYLQAMGIPVLRGRDIDERDRAGAVPVMMISEAAARKHFPNEDPLGKRIILMWTREDTIPVSGTIVGVVGSTRAKSLHEDARPELYLPHAQIPDQTMTMVARTTGGSELLSGRLRHVVRALDPSLAIANLRSLDTVLQKSLAPRRLYTTLLGSFAGVALLLAAVGIFGVISVMVSQRRAEIGVRMALGAAPNEVLRLIVGDALRLVTIGVAIGLAGAVALTRVLESMLFGVSTTDPMTFAVTAGLLITVALAASALPALSAARTDPNVVLRS